MKRILLTVAIIVGISYFASAQTSGSSSANGPSVSSSRAKAKTGKNKKSQADSLNTRKTYKWKDGQRATPTGHEATGTNGSESPMPKSSATMSNDSTKHDQ